jgi:hypothetical protein
MQLEDISCHDVTVVACGTLPEGSQGVQPKYLLSSKVYLPFKKVLVDLMVYQI